MRSNQISKLKLSVHIYSFILIMFGLLISGKISGQATNRMLGDGEGGDIEKTSYRLFTELKWDSLIQFNTYAIKQGTDYFYLRERLGIAWYEKQNYRKAVENLEVAYTMNPTDNYNNATLYWCYLNAGRRGDASLFGIKMSNESQAYYKYSKSKLVENVFVESGPSFSGNYKAQEDIQIQGTDTTIYGENNLSGNSFYTHAGITTKLFPWLKIYQGYSQINTDMQKRSVFRIQYPSITDHDTTGAYQNKQHEYYLSASIFPKQGWTITPSFHYIYSEALSFNYHYYWDTTLYWANPGWDTAQTVQYYDNYAFIDTAKIFHNYVASLGISYDYKAFNFYAYGSFSRINSLNQKSAGFSISWFPKGNLDIYSVSSLSVMQSEYWKLGGSSGKGYGAGNGISSYSKQTDNRLILNQKLGVKLQHKIWLEGSISFGDLDMYSDQNAFIVYNVADKIKQKAGLALICPINPRYELFLRYNRYLRQSSYITYTGSETFTTNSVNYLNHSVIGGIKWYF